MSDISSEIKVEMPVEAAPKRRGRPPGVKNGVVNDSEKAGGEISAGVVKNSPKINISIDFSVEKVVELNEMGFGLTFDPTPEGFIKLPEDVVQDLDYENRVAYGVASHLHASLSKEREERPTEGLEILGEVAVSASRRQSLIGGDPNMHYAWRRPDEIDEIARQGYKPATKDEVTTYGRRLGGFDHVIAAFGRVELILFKIPKKLFEVLDAQPGAQSRERIEASKAEASEKIEEAGGKVYDPETDKSTDRRVSWRDEVVNG